MYFEFVIIIYERVAKFNYHYAVSVKYWVQNFRKEDIWTLNIIGKHEKGKVLLALNIFHD